MKLHKKMKHAENKGFSLVELIIVIAIMAVLVGVLTPAYLKYVDSSRQSADVQSIDAIISAMEVVAIDPTLTIAGDTEMKAIFGKENDKEGILKIEVSNEDEKGEITTVLKELIGEYTLKTAAWKGLTVIGTVGTDGKLTFEFTGAGAAEAKKAGNFGSKVTVEGENPEGGGAGTGGNTEE